MNKLVKLPLFWLGIIIGVLLTIIFLHNLILNINKPLDLSHNDSFQMMFILKHYMNTLFSGNFKDILTLPSFYGFENSLLFNEHLILQAFIALPFFVLTKNIIISYNILSILTLIFSFISMYLFTFYILKWYSSHNQTSTYQIIIASLFSGVIFVFNPYVFARFPDHLNLISLQYIPLIFLSLEGMIIKPTSKLALLFFVSLALQILSSFYYAVFLTVILPVYILVRFLTLEKERRNSVNLLKAWWNKGTIVGIVLVFLVCITTFRLYFPVVSQVPIDWSKDKTSSLAFSAWFSDWFLTPASNVFYGNLQEGLKKVAPSFIHNGNPSEQNLFWGIIPLTLFFLSFRLAKTAKIKRIWKGLVFLLIFSFLLSFGPQIHLTESWYFPGLFKIAALINPLLSFTRVPARMAVFVFFFLAIIVAITIYSTIDSISKRRSTFIVLVLVFLLLVGINMEYYNRPLTYLSISKETKKFYEVLNRQKYINVILDLPIANLTVNVTKRRIEYLDAHYLLYATILHNKKLFNGYQAYAPLLYYERAGLLTLDFPSLETLRQARSWGIDAIILHRDEFNQPADYYLIRSELHRLKVPEIEEIGGLALFDITKWKEVP